MLHTAIALLAAALSLEAAAAVHLLPAGEFAGRDGRPGKGLTWKITDAQGHALAARLTERHKAARFNLDYEHQVMLSEKNGQPAPASGWAQRFEWRDGVGLYALDVQWTARALEMLKAGEYRYISPVITFNKTTGEVVDVLNASLVAIPNLMDLDPVAQERVAQLNALYGAQHPEHSMNPILKVLLSALGLQESATEEQATAALTSLKTQAGQVAGLQTEVAALKAQSTATPDPSKYVSVEAFNSLNTEIVALKALNNQREVDQLIDQAKADGKLTPAAEAVWRDVGKANVAQLRALIDKTPGNPALAGRSQTGGHEPEGGTGGEQDPEAISVAANKFMAEQAAAGIHVSAAEAVDHVMKQKGKA